MDRHLPSVKEIFDHAHEVRSAAERRAYLDQACAGQPGLRQKVDDLLRAYDEAGSFLESPPESPGTVDLPPITEGPGSRIGPYKLLQQIGEGGMGVVYMAEQEQPVRRRVALKIIKPGMDTAQVVARFEAERQALALMDHQNIARVLDVGATETGRPFFVMELVNGIPITKYCDQEHLTPRERLELFVPVCQAVQHAHQKGIIHRDLKPSNVLVALYDGKPVPKVIDFGVAKATSQRLTERTMFTEFGQVIGTLEYMAPEQAERNALDVDTRCDIYSLGVLLYELLTGSTPLDKKKLHSAVYTEMMRMIREDEPAKPSTRLSESGDALPAISAQRKTEPAKLSKLMRGELDWIVMKALEKDRSRRYETANGLVRDIQRHLADEPVEACPPSARYRLRKFTRKNRKLLATAACFTLLLLAGAGAATWQAVRATAAERRALAAADAAEAAKENEASERRRVEAAHLQAFEALRATTDDVVTRLIGEKPVLGPTEKEFLENTLKRWQAFDLQTGTAEQARWIRAEGTASVARLRDRLGQTEEAVSGWRDAVKMWEGLAADFPAESRHRRNCARALKHLAEGLLLLGRHSESETESRRALIIQEKLAVEFPANVVYQHDLATILDNLGNLLMVTDRWVEAEAAFRRALGIHERLSKIPDAPDQRPSLAAMHANVGLQLVTRGKYAEGEAEYRRALPFAQALVAEFPTVLKYRQNLALDHINFGRLYSITGRPTEAESEHRKAIAILEKLATEFPAIPDYREQLAAVLGALVTELSQVGKWAEAESVHRRAIALNEALVAEGPAIPKHRRDLAEGHNSLAILHKDQGKYAEAEPIFRKALAMREKLAAEFPDVAKYRGDVAHIRINLAFVLSRLKRSAEEDAERQRATEIYERLAAEFPADSNHRFYLAICFNDTGVKLMESGRRSDAEAPYRRALAIYETLIADFGPLPIYLTNCGGTLCNMGNLLTHKKQHEPSLEWYGKAIAMKEQARQQIPNDVRNRDYLCNAYKGRADAFNALKRPAEAAADWDKVLELCRESKRSYFRLQRAVSRARAGQIEVAVQDAEELAKDGDALTQYNAACVYALAAASRDQPAEARADRAMELLRQAVTKGWTDFELTKKDDDLNALRTREDFQNLLADLEKEKTSPKKDAVPPFSR